MKSFNKKINLIEVDESFEFSFAEQREEVDVSPVSEYYFNARDLSINLSISLKWLKWGYKFFILISNELKESNSYESLTEYTWENMITNSIQDKRAFFTKEEEHILLIEDKIIKDYNDIVNLLNDKFIVLYNENTKINLKLKINLREFILLSNFFFPTFAKVEKL